MNKKTNCPLCKAGVPIKVSLTITDRITNKQYTMYVSEEIYNKLFKKEKIQYV